MGLKALLLALFVLPFFNVITSEALNGLGWERPHEKACNFHGRISVNNGNVADMMVRIDAGWYSFAYGKANSIAYRTFGVVNSQVVIFYITSCFCLGNAFSVYDNGQPILTTSNQNLTPSCTNRTVTPGDCASWPSMSSGSALLLPGRHNLTIVPIVSPYGGGTGFIRVDTACPVPGSATPMPCCETFNTCSQVIMA